MMIFRRLVVGSILLLVLSGLIEFPAPILAQVLPTNSGALSGNVTDASGKPVSGAAVTLTGIQSAATHTDANGHFMFAGMPLGGYTITVTSATLGTVSRSFSLQGDVNVAIRYESSAGLKTIANVNTRSNAHFNITSASITQVNPADVAFNGQTSWRKILEQIPGISAGDIGHGDNPFEAIAGSPLVPIEISIDGALPYETATLLDDMPLIGGGPALGYGAGWGTNLSSYPLNGFTAGDVVRGPGANAPSIVDSIGGSFVLHPAARVDQNRYAFSVSNDPYGGIVTDGMAAFRLNRLSATVSYGFNDSPGPLQGNGVSLYQSGKIATINGYACKRGCGTYSFLSDNNFSNSPQYGVQNSLLVCCAPESTAWSQHSGSVALQYEFSPSATAEVFYAGQSSLTSQPFPFYTYVFAPPAGYSGSFAAGQSTFDYANRYLGPVPTTYSSSLFEEKIATQIGSGTLRVAALQNRTYQTYHASSPTSGVYRLFGGASICSNTSPDCSSGTYTPAIFNGGTYDLTLHSAVLTNDSFTNNFDLLASYSTQLGSRFHAGVSFVRSYYNTPFSSDLSVSDSETTTETRVYVGGEVAPRTQLDISQYFANADYHVQDPTSSSATPPYIDERYSYAAPRIGLVWRPSEQIAVRGSAGGGFAEAPLPLLIGSNFVAPFGPYFENFATNVNLQPEKSFAFDAGMDWRLPHNTIVSFDVYRANLFGQLNNSTTLTTTDYQGTGLPLYTAEVSNLNRSRYEGILAEIRHNVERGFNWSFSGGLTRGYVLDVPPGFYDDPSVPCTKCANLNIIAGPNFNGTYTFGSSIPYSQALATIGERWDPRGYADIVGTYFGNNNAYFRPAFVAFDGHLSLPVSNIASLLLTVRNIGNVYGGAYTIYAPSNFVGVPTLAGLPYGEYSQQYGPRSLILTLQFQN